ncbi:MAG: phage holin family protein [Oceanipulchritudo sp.]
MPRFSSTIFLRDAVILFLGILGATWLVSNIQAASGGTLILVALVLALLNVILKPVLVLFTLPFVIFTFGLGLILINAVLLFLAGQLVPGFTVPTFGSALLGALVVSLVNLALHLLIAPRPGIHPGSF